MNPPHVLLVSRCFIQKDNSVLLLHRTHERHYNPNRWELPGGKIEAGQDITNATEREIIEETGLLIKITSPKTFTEAKIVESGKYKGMTYLELVNEAVVIGGNLKLSPDHSEYQWVPHEKVFDFDLSLEARKALTVFLASH